MRKPYIVIMLLVLMFTLMCGCSSDNTTGKSSSKDDIHSSEKEQTPVSQSKRPYKEYIENILNSSDEDMGEMGYAALYDLNNDNSDELVIMRVKDVNFVYTVCTIKDDKVVPLVEDEHFFVLAGGPSGDVYILKNDVETLISFEYGEINPGDEVLYNHGTVDAYSFDGEQLKLQKEAELLRVTTMSIEPKILYDQSEATVNDENTTYKEFEQWHNSYEKTLLLNMHPDDSAKLENFVKEL